MLSMVRQYFHEACYLVILNQSTSVQPPSLVTIAGRVQNMPTLAPIHLPSLLGTVCPMAGISFR